MNIRRFTDLQEELKDEIGLDEYNQGMQELRLLDTQLEGTALSKRAKKELRQLIERRQEVLQFEESRKNAKLTYRVLALEESAGNCPNGKNHRLQIRRNKNGEFFWGCSFFPSCWYSKPLTDEERERVEG